MTVAVDSPIPPPNPTTQPNPISALFYSGRLLLGREVKMDAKPKGAAAAKASAASATAGGNDAPAGAAGAAASGEGARGGRGVGRGALDVL